MFAQRNPVPAFWTVRTFAAQIGMTATVWTSAGRKKKKTKGSVADEQDGPRVQRDVTWETATNGPGDASEDDNRQA
jgi:hypothetical protein